MILRSVEPWTMSHGYHNDPKATAGAWRNGWFHTGDPFRRDEAGDFFFVDRPRTRSAGAARTSPPSRSRAVMRPPGRA